MTPLTARAQAKRLLSDDVLDVLLSHMHINEVMRADILAALAPLLERVEAQQTHRREILAGVWDIRQSGLEGLMKPGEMAAYNRGLRAAMLSDTAVAERGDHER